MTSIRHDLGPFAMVPKFIVVHTSALAQKMWCVLWIYSGNGNHAAWPSHARLAADMGCSRRTVQRILDELAAVGALDMQRRDGTSSLYTLHWKVDTGDAPPYDTHVVPPTTPVTHKERLSEIDLRHSTKNDDRVHIRVPGDAPLTREEIRKIREQYADIERAAREKP